MSTSSLFALPGDVPARRRICEMLNKAIHRVTQGAEANGGSRSRGKQSGGWSGEVGRDVPSGSLGELSSGEGGSGLRVIYSSDESD
jgi:hypothetical protein